MGGPWVTRVSPMSHQWISRVKFHGLTIQGAQTKSEFIQIVYIVNCPSNLLRAPQIRIPTSRDMPVWSQQHPPYGGMDYKRHYSQHKQAAHTYFPIKSHQEYKPSTFPPPILHAYRAPPRVDETVAVKLIT